MAFIRAMPKVELHAHLSGSLSPETIATLVDHHKVKYPDEKLPEELFSGDVKSFDYFFATFKAAQVLVDHPEAVEIAVKNTISEFAADNVKYLELRTTPRAVEGRMTTRQHVQTLIKAIEASKNDDILCTLLLSIDRRRSIDQAKDTLELCLKMKRIYPSVLVGMDFSGDARSNDAMDFVPLLKTASDNGLKLAVHLAEVPNAEETTSVLKSLKIDRIGHGTHIHPDKVGGLSPDDWHDLHNDEIPFEICLSSNVSCQSVPNYDDHHIKLLMQSGHPFCICTDDKGAFNCTLSEEYEWAQKILKLSDLELYDLSFKAIDMIFASDEVKANLKIQFRTWLKLNCDRD